MRLKLFTFLWINLSSCGAELSSFRSHRVTVLLTFLCLLLLLLKCLTSCLQRKLFRYTLSLLVRLYEIECEMEEVFKRMMETETFPYKLSHRKNFPFWYFFWWSFSILLMCLMENMNTENVLKESSSKLFEIWG